MISYEKLLKTCSPQSDILSLQFKKLPLGDIKCPEGWLGTQLELMAEGITGRLPEYGPFFRKDANGFLHPETNAGWEEVPYWFRGYYPLAVLLNDKSMLDYAQKYIDAIFASAQDDGWFGPAYLKTYEKTADGVDIPDIFPNILLTDALFLYYEYTKDERVPALYGKFVKFCLDLPDEAFLPKAAGSRLIWQKIRSGDMIPQLHHYYEMTGDRNALALAKIAYLKNAKSVTGFAAVHAVDIAHRFAYDALYYRQSKEKAHWDKAFFEYEKIASVWGQMPGGIFGADEQVRTGAIDPRQGYEPCGMVELANKYYELGRISGDGLFADKTEDVMLNHFPASFTEDYKGIRYVTAANMPISDDERNSDTFNGTKVHNRSWFIMTPNNRCCGHNTGMGWPWYAMNLWQETADGGLVACLYAPNEVETTVGGHRISLKMNTSYPFTGDIAVTVKAGGTYPLYFRIPQWNVKCTVSVNGSEFSEYPQKGGFVRIEKEWREGDTIALSFEMPLYFTRWDGNGSVSIYRGPLAYSVRIGEGYSVTEDAGAYNHPEPHLFDNYDIVPTTPWNYGLCFDGSDISAAVTVESVASSLPKQPFANKNAPVVLKALAKRIPEWTLQNGMAAELQQSPIYSDAAEEQIELIPLGCARLRMSCLPVVTDNPNAFRWEKTPENIPNEEKLQGFPKQYDM